MAYSKCWINAGNNNDYRSSEVKARAGGKLHREGGQWSSRLQPHSLRPSCCESDPCTTRGSTDELQKWQGSSEIAWQFLFLCPYFLMGSQLLSGLRKTFLRCMAEAPSSQCRMTPSRGLRPFWFLGYLPPLWPQYPTCYLSSCFVNLEVNSYASSPQ